MLELAPDSLSHYCCASMECGWIEADYFGSLSAPVSPWVLAQNYSSHLPDVIGSHSLQLDQKPIEVMDLGHSYLGKKPMVSPFLFFLTGGMFKFE